MLVLDDSLRPLLEMEDGSLVGLAERIPFLL